MVRSLGHVCQGDQSISQRLALNCDLLCLLHESSSHRKSGSHHSAVIYSDTIQHGHIHVHRGNFTIAVLSILPHVSLAVQEDEDCCRGMAESALSSTSGAAKKLVARKPLLCVNRWNIVSIYIGMHTTEDHGC